MTKYLLLAAMDCEFLDIINKENFEKRKLKTSGIEIWEKKFVNCEISIAKIGVGPINASIYLTQLLIDSTYDEVVLLGLGGANDLRLKSGDTVIASNVVQHDSICSYNDKIEFMACGELHLSVEKENRSSIYMMTTSQLGNRFSCYLKNNNEKYFTGTILSGSEFVGSYYKKSFLKQEFQSSLLIDMESCAVAYICTKSNIKFSIIKTVADSLSNASTEQYIDYLKSSFNKCYNLINYIKSL